MTQSEEAGKFYASTFATANYQDSGCVFANIRIVFGGQLKQVRRLKIASMEGNVTINMLDEGQAEILELDSRVITGHSSIRVKVPGEATIGGSVGTIRGDLELGNTFAVNMVEGNVAVNLAKSPSSRAMQGKVVVAQGNVTVGLVRKIRAHIFCKKKFVPSFSNQAHHGADFFYCRYRITMACTQSRQVTAMQTCKTLTQNARW